MICSSCQKQPNCLPALLAENDTALADMLTHLKDCNLRPASSQPRLLQKLVRPLKAVWSGLWHRLAAVGGRLGLS